MRVLIAVTHLLGTGHLRRALTLGRAFATAGHDVQIASGGMPVPQFDTSGITLRQLPPLRSDGTQFTTLLDQTGAPASAALLQARETALCTILRDHHPDILITELYPFGRRVLSDEFQSLLSAAQALSPRPVVLASVRDILAPPSKPTKATRADQIISQFYDAVLVHSDPNTTRLDQSWPVSASLAQYLRYTGYVAPAASPALDETSIGDIIVSAGGGAVGTSLYETALAAAAQLPQHTWRVLVGGNDAADRIAALCRKAPPNAIVEPNRSDFRQRLYHATASISMCGYNTALDLLQAGTPAVLVPFDAGNEVEQGLRANSLAHLSGISVLRSADLTTETLCDAVKTVISAGRRTEHTVQFDGATRTVALACNMAQART